MVKLLLELDEHIDRLATELGELFGIHLTHAVKNQFDSVDVLLIDLTYPCGKDWRPHMSFTVLLLKNIVILKSIRLPKELQGLGIGSHCFQWLIELCKIHGIEAIEGEAVGNSRGFWDKKGVIHTPKKSIYRIKDS